ncbi:MAG: tripartite tricarboxylate transporter substrate binding protein [Rubrivivax sp.]|jgi:tripartite-type tricarboxylate transporter receptor subunit TctC|nr:tripartite tricarboxylate transporter substrate binding protein [Rubrivivax sp.]MDP3611605.1 tripartite tricarboxylate transporter substrate binding protein [Rubrivivax sp.]
MTPHLARTAHHLARCFTIALLMGMASLAAQAQYPNKPIRLVAPFGPGSASDTLLRTIAEPLGTALGQSVVVDNKPGAMTVLAVEHVAKSAPDGYTVVAATNSIVANPAGVLRSVNYDPFRDFTPITRLAGTSYVLVVAADQPWKTLDELIAHARANPGKLNYASGNLGGVLYGGMLQRSIGVDMVHVPYKSTPPALLELLAGRVHLMFTDLVTASGQVKAGKVRALLATATQRTALFPDVPTIAESGIKGFANMPAWWALYGPAGMPSEAVERLNREITAILQRPDIRSRLLAMGIDAVPSSPQGLADFTREQSQSYVRLIKEFNIQPE